MVFKDYTANHKLDAVLNCLYEHFSFAFPFESICTNLGIDPQDMDSKYDVALVIEYLVNVEKYIKE